MLVVHKGYFHVLPSLRAVCTHLCSFSFLYDDLMLKFSERLVLLVLIDCC